MLLGGSMELLQIGSRMVLLVYTEFLLCTLSALLHTHTHKKKTRKKKKKTKKTKKKKTKKKKSEFFIW